MTPSTRGQALLAAFGLHREVVVAQKKEEKKKKREEDIRKMNNYRTAQKSGGRHPPALRLCLFQAQHKRRLFLWSQENQCVLF